MKIFTICFWAAMCFAGANLNALEEIALDPVILEEQQSIFQKETAENIDHFWNTFNSLFTPLGTDILDPQKLCDVSHLNKINHLLDGMPASMKKCYTVYIQRQRDIETRFAYGLFSKTEDRALCLQSFEENDEGGRWVDQFYEIEISLVQQLKETINFFLQNRGHYQVQNNQLIFGSMDKVKRGSALLEKISNLKQKEAEHMNRLPKS